jgi:hypothetical protein
MRPPCPPIEVLAEAHGSAREGTARPDDVLRDAAGGEGLRRWEPSRPRAGRSPPDGLAGARERLVASRDRRDHCPGGRRTTLGSPEKDVSARDGLPESLTARCGARGSCRSREHRCGRRCGSANTSCRARHAASAAVRRGVPPARELPPGARATLVVETRPPVTAQLFRAGEAPIRRLRRDELRGVAVTEPDDVPARRSGGDAGIRVRSGAGWLSGMYYAELRAADARVGSTSGRAPRRSAYPPVARAGSREAALVGVRFIGVDLSRRGPVRRASVALRELDLCPDRPLAGLDLRVVRDRDRQPGHPPRRPACRCSRSSRTSSALARRRR